MESPIADASVRLTLRLVVREALSAYRARFRRVAVPAICVLVPISLVETVAEQLEHRYGDDQSVAVRIAVVAAFLVAGVAGELGLVFYAGLLDRLIGAYLRGNHDPPVGEVLRTLPYRRLVGADLLLIVLMVVGFLLFIIPGLAVLTFFGIIGPLINTEGHGVFRSFRESARLVRPRFFLVFFATTVPVLLEGGIDSAISSTIWERGVVSGLLVNAILAVLVLATVGLLEVVLANGLIVRDHAKRAEREASS